MRVRPVFLIFINLELRASDEKLVCDYEEPCDEEFSNNNLVFKQFLNQNIKSMFGLLNRPSNRFFLGNCIA